MKKNLFVLPILLFILSCSTLAPSTLKTTPDNPQAEINRLNNETLSLNQLPESESTTVSDIPELQGDLKQLDTPVPETQPDEQAIFDQALDLCNVSQEFWQKGELENALDSLDQAYSLIININISDSPKLIQQKDDLRFMISRRILEIYASRNIVVNGNHNAIPIIINKDVQKEINCFTKRERLFFAQSLKRSGRYRPMILAELKKAGLPAELSWLPLVESGFKVNALSKARALGLWQFIPSTGYMYGLNRNLFIDERLDPEKATKAAVAYLKKMHGIFGDWSTVLAAYNCGEGRVLRIIRSQNVNYLDDFWDLYNKLPRETARYVPRFMATLHIVNNLEKYGFDPAAIDTPFEYETATITKQVRLKDIAATLGVSKSLMKDLNPELRHNILPGETYQLNVPTGKSEQLLAAIDSIKVSHPPQKAYVYHRVRHGETLSTISRRYKTSMRSIARANNISKKNFIVAGKLLKIPQRGYTYGKYAHNKPSVVRRDLTSTSHRVKRGDSLWIIARKYDTTVSKIKRLNNLSGNSLSIGQRLKLPERSVKKASKTKSGSGVYYVKRGDSPFTIAMQHNIPLNRLLKLNRLTPKSKIYPGQELFIE